MKVIQSVAVSVALAAVACTPKTTETASTPKTPEVTVKPDQLTTIDEAYMNKSIRPQDDFFLFANGTWCVNNPVPASESRWGSFNELDQRNKRMLTQILETAQSKGAEKGTQSQLLGDYYAAFTNMKQRNAA